MDLESESSVFSLSALFFHTFLISLGHCPPSCQPSIGKNESVAIIFELVLPDGCVAVVVVGGVPRFLAKTFPLLMLLAKKKC